MDDIPLHERFERYDDILRHLTAMLVTQREANQRQEVTNQELKAFNERQVAINQDVSTTLARIETLLARMIARSDNGTDA
jgi:hypothetical protein